MWKSWGDKYEIVPYDREKRPRKVSGSRFLISVVAILCFISSRVAWYRDRPEDSMWNYVPFIFALLGAVACLVLFVLKWKKNDQECDTMLIYSGTGFLILAYIILTV